MVCVRILDLSSTRSVGFTVLLCCSLFEQHHSELHVCTELSCLKEFIKSMKEWEQQQEMKEMQQMGEAGVGALFKM